MGKNKDQSGSTCALELPKHILHAFAATVEQQMPNLIHPPKKKKVIVIAGPTGSGKTTLSLKLARLLDGEIISADSMQVYRGMDIGTAKVKKADREVVTHHLIDVCDINESFNVKDFFDQAKVACQDILLRGKVPIVVGGTGFYIHALLYGPPEGPKGDKRIREFLEIEEEKFGIEFLYEKLFTLDPEYGRTITKNDKQKVLRALEIILTSGKRVSDFSWKERPLIPFFDFRPWFLYYPKELLYKRLEARCDDMLQEGLLEEVIHLERLGLRENSTASQAIGYRQTLEYLDTAKTQQDYELFVQKLKQASRNLAKRQFTWFRRETIFDWVDLSQKTEEEVLNMILDDFHDSSKTCTA